MTIIDKMTGLMETALEHLEHGGMSRADGRLLLHELLKCQTTLAMGLVDIFATEGIEKKGAVSAACPEPTTYPPG